MIPMMTKSKSPATPPTIPPIKAALEGDSQHFERFESVGGFRTVAEGLMGQFYKDGMFLQS